MQHVHARRKRGPQNDMQNPRAPHLSYLRLKLCNLFRLLQQLRSQVLCNLIVVALGVLELAHKHLVLICYPDELVLGIC